MCLEDAFWQSTLLSGGTLATTGFVLESLRSQFHTKVSLKPRVIQPHVCPGISCQACVQGISLA